MKFTQGFEKFNSEKYGQLEDTFKRLEGGQSPHTLLITCSDSRIVPSLIGQYGPGEVFVIRNAGNAVPAYNEESGDSVAATIEYAIEVLGIKEVVICGHAKCGAVGATLGGVPESLKLITSYLKVLEPLKARCSHSDSEEFSIHENVRMQIENLKAYPFISNKSDVEIKGLYYDFINGTLLKLKGNHYGRY